MGALSGCVGDVRSAGGDGEMLRFWERENEFIDLETLLELGYGGCI